MTLNCIYITHKIFNQLIMKRKSLKVEKKKWVNEKENKFEDDKIKERLMFEYIYLN